MEAGIYDYAKSRYKSLRQKIGHWKNTLTDPHPKLLVIVYHRVLPEVTFNPFNTIVSLKTFVRQIEMLTKRYSIMPLSDAVGGADSWKIRGETLLVITFDDGYWDNYEIVFEILNKKGLPATFFLAVDYINSGKPLWDWDIITLVNRLSAGESIPVGAETFEREVGESNLSFAFRLIERLKRTQAEVIQEVVGYLKSRLGDDASLCGPMSSCMTWKQVQVMSAHGMEIGSHSMSHRSLSRIAPEEALSEIKNSKQIIENHIGKRCVHFAFPFGSRKDYNQAVLGGVRDAGFRTSLLNIHGYNRMPQDAPDFFCFKRVIMTETTDIRYLLG
ncbi:MAG TPA: polysaccharide deacetylase family protein [Nitrososphaera sp.]|nr:polysaccharide deacetylase family protein [Nitrososphaera sp.]